MDEVREDVREIEVLLREAKTSSGDTAQVTIQSAYPPDWHVMIELAGVKFFYRDGSDYTGGPHEGDLGSGGIATFTSDVAEKCVYQFFVALQLKVSGENSQPLTWQNSVPAG